MEPSSGESQRPSEGFDEVGPFKLYQMALPHIVQSNLRVQKYILIERIKHRVRIIWFTYFLILFSFIEKLH